MRQILSSFDEYLSLECGRSNGTVKRYLAVARELIAFLKKSVAGTSLTAATTSDVRGFLRRASITREGLRSGFVWNQKLAAIRTLYRFLVKFDHADENPTDDLRIMEVDARDRVPLTLAEFAALLSAIEERPEPFRSRDRALAHIAFHCALRVQELNRLDLAHLDFQHRLIVNLRVKRKKFLVVPFPPQALDALRCYLALRTRFDPAVGESALFVSERGHRLSVRQMQELVSFYGKSAGILRRISPHYLRHSSATAHALRGTQPWDVQRLLGHESLSTTERYIHPLDSLKAAVDALAQELDTVLTAKSAVHTSSASRSGVVSSSASAPLLTDGESATTLSWGPKEVTA